MACFCEDGYKLCGEFIGHVNNLLTTSFQLQRLKSTIWEEDHEWWISKDLKGGCCGLFEGVILGFIWRDRGKPQKPFKIVSNLPKILKQLHPTYHYANKLGRIILYHRVSYMWHLIGYKTVTNHAQIFPFMKIFYCNLNTLTSTLNPCHYHRPSGVQSLKYHWKMPKHTDMCAVHQILYKTMPCISFMCVCCGHDLASSIITLLTRAANMFWYRTAVS